MPYLGNTPSTSFATVVKDTFNGGSTGYTLSKVATTNSVSVFVENVRQEPTTAYSVSGTTLTFTATTPSGTGNIYVLHMNPTTTTTHPAAQALTATTGTFSGGITGTTGTFSGAVTNNSTTTLNDDVTFTGANYNVVWDKSDDALEFADSAKAVFGTGSDLSVHWDGTDGHITVGGTLNIDGSGETLAKFIDDGAVELYHNNSKKSETTTNGIVVGGATAETHNSSMKTVQVGARGFLTPFDSGATYLTSNIFYNTSSSWEYATDGGGNVLSLNNGSFYVYHCENGSDGGTPTLIERVQIYNNNSNNDNYNFFIANRNSISNYFINKHSSDPYGAYIYFENAAPDNNTQYFLRCVDSSTARLTIYSDGDVSTSDAGTLTSDIKNKNTITDATDKWDDVKKLQVRNFYWNEDYHPKKKDKKMIGFIAQEFETVFPGLVTEIKDEIAVTEKDEDGNDTTVHKDLGTTTKVIKEGKLIPILTKALQEAMERIETLEAEVAKLKE